MTVKCDVDLGLRRNRDLAEKQCNEQCQIAIHIYAPPLQNVNRAFPTPLRIS